MSDLDELLSHRFHDAGENIEPTRSGEEVARSLGSLDVSHARSSQERRHRRLVGAGLAAFVIAVLGVIALTQRPGGQDGHTSPTPDVSPITTAPPGTIFVPTGVTPQIPEGCLALHGTDPWITLHGGGPNPGSCVAMAADGSALIFNKDFDTVTVELPGGPITLGPDEWHRIRPAVDGLEPGVHRFSSSPYLMPEIWVLPRSESQLSSLALEADGLGPFRLGLTLEDAAEAWGGELTTDWSASPGPRCWIASGPNDPYSPVLVVEGDGGPQSHITQVWVQLPGQPSVGGIEVGMSAEEATRRATDAGYAVEPWSENDNVLDWMEEGVSGVQLVAPGGDRALIVVLNAGGPRGPDEVPSTDTVRQLTISSPDAYCSGPWPFDRN